jgi:hypothetical protein
MNCYNGIMDYISPNKNKLEEVCKKNLVEFLGVFGSVARGEYTKDSDVDVLVRFSPRAKIGYFKLYEIEQEIARSLGKKIDLVTQDALSPYIKDRVYSDLKPIYGQP